MNVLIVEDESLAAERLSLLINKYNKGINVLKILDTIKESADYLQENENVIDLVFLDIQLSDGTSFEIFNKIDFARPIIFTTAYDQYSLKAFKLNSIDYLLKPVKYDELCNALDKYKRLYDAGYPPQSIDLDTIRELISKPEKHYKKRFIVKYGNQIQFKPVEDIAYIFAEGKIAYIVLKGSNRKYVIDHTLEALESDLLDPNDFFRINRRFILKIDVINNIKSYSNSRLEIKLNEHCEQQLVVSRERVSTFKSWLNT